MLAEEEIDENSDDDFVLGNETISKQRNEPGERKNEKPIIAMSFEEAMNIIKSHEIENNARFICAFSTKDFGNTDIKKSKHRLYWSTDSIKFSGVPFMILGTKYMDCHHGEDRNVRLKEKLKKNRETLESTDHAYKRKHNRVQNSKKFGCPAKVAITEYVEFPDFKLEIDTVRKRKMISEQVRNQLTKESVDVSYTRKFNIILPCISSHIGHPVSKMSGVSQRIDRELVSQIESYVKEGVSDTREMKLLLKIHVKNTIFKGKNLPDPTNRRYFPRKSTILNHICRVRRGLRHSMIDQECLEHKIEEWKKVDPGAKVLYRPKSEIKKSPNERNNLDGMGSDDSNNDTFLFVYQNSSQKRLFNKYGNEMVLLDATYRTTRYSLPLFFLVVKTNVDYQIVAVFVCENETEKCITEALAEIKKWNPDVKPRYAMTDYCNEEIHALENVFKGCNVFICNFHREQAWDRWLKRKTNGCSDDKAKILSLLRSIAHSESTEELEVAEQSLRNSVEWKENEALQEYISKYWLPIKERWVNAFRNNRLLINCNTNNGVERQNSTLKHIYLSRHRNTSLTGMLTVVIEDFLPEKYQSYCDNNYMMSSSYSKYAINVDKYLYNRPKPLITHCLLKKRLSENIDTSAARILEPGQFDVTYIDDGVKKSYTVTFGDDNQMPWCTCKSFKTSAYPCKHFFVVFRAYPGWNWNSLSPLYINSPYLNLDLDYATNESLQTENLPVTKETTIEADNAKTPSDSEGGTNKDSICNNEQEVPEIIQNTDSKPSPPSPVDGEYSQKLPEKAKIQTFSRNGENIRSMLTSIEKLSYLIESNKSFSESVYHRLSSILSDMEENVPKEKGVPLRPVKIAPKFKTKRKSTYTDLPLPKRKSKATRVGEKEEEKIRASKIDITKERCEGSGGNVEVEVVETANDFGDPVFTTTPFEKIVISDSDDNYNNAPIVTEKSLYSTPRSNITNKDLKDLSNRRMLNDNVIKVFQDMIKLECNVSGLQDPILGQTLAFNVYRTEPMLQVLHNGDNHWVAVSTYGCTRGEINLMDSLFKNKMSKNLEKQICSIVNFPGDELKVNVLPVQQQQNGVDCGLFALAFVYYIAIFKENPTNISFQAEKFREHLLHCLRQNKMSPFPLAPTKRRKFCLPKQIALSLFCSCRLPWDDLDKRIYNRHMAECTLCKNWFHRLCENIPANVFTNKLKDELWLCSSCKEVRL